MSKYLFNVIVALDVFLMTVLFAGKRNETISACLYAIERDGKWYGTPLRKAVDLLMSWREYEHCRIQFELEQKWNRTFNE